MKKYFFLIICLQFIFAAHAQQTATCSYCNGYGKFACQYCGGYGRVFQTYYDPYWGPQQVQVICSFCSGAGGFMCQNCSGKGYVVIYKSNSNSNSNSNSLSFKGKGTPYAAECVHCKCKLYVPKSTADSYCSNCESNKHYKALKKSHVTRYF